MRVMHYHYHDHQIVDWKSPVEQLNGYDTLRVFRAAAAAADPFDVLAGTYPVVALEEMREHYAEMRALVAA
jgi:hypothetical protein